MTKTMKNLFWRIVRYFDLYSDYRQTNTTQDIISEQLRREGLRGAPERPCAKVDKKEN